MDCEKAAHIIDKKDFKEVSFWEKFTLKLHNFLCKKCRGYEKDTHILRRLMSKISTEAPCLTCDEKEVIKNNLKQQS